MNQLITIRAVNRPGTEKVFTNAKMKVKEDEKETVVGNYKGNKFPGTKRLHTPFFSQTKGQWLCSMSQEELNNHVKTCHLRDKNNNLITSCDLRNRRDSFITHPELSIWDNEGRTDLDLDDSKTKVLIAFLEPLGEYHNPEKGQNMMSSRVKYEIIRPEVIHQQNTARSSSKMKAYVYLDKLSEEKRMKIAVVLKRRVKPKTDAGVITTELANAIEDNFSFDDRDFVTAFMDACEMDPERLELNFLFSMGVKQGSLKKTSEGYLLFGNSIGQGPSQVLNYLKDPENIEVIQRLRAAAGIK